ncbi:uncharacterized protein EAF01_008786 [Botrytis porri]|uniref:uncharacterized protein n=1 Tax=Botrytis porri TaxID=87229 RepID=UPI0018FFF6E1|nr:uncharacterized protein EAF01_008786 [Botrytis porri]KAF7897820.1 hypothetical protein EAF01_008786 [Botrytis porri]
MSAKIDKIIAQGTYYEAHQQTRVVASRYIKSQNYPAAADILYSVSLSLLQAAQGGSGGDLALFLLEVYNTSSLPCDSSSKGRLFTLLRAFSPEEPSRKRFITETIAWSSKTSAYPAGDPELHHVIGSLLAEEGEVYDAERHLILGTKDSAEVLAKMEYEWYVEDDSHTAALYASRAVLPYLLVGNVRDARKSLGSFTSRLREVNAGLTVQELGGTNEDIKIYPSIPLLNFLGLLLVAVQKGNSLDFKQLTKKYAGQMKEAGEMWEEALTSVGEMYFGIQRPRQGNPLLDMMGSMFGGGMGGGAQQPQARRIGQSGSAPVAEGLD